MPIGREWNLTAEKHEKAEMDGPRTKLLISTGHPTLKHGTNLFRGPWDIDAKADRIETNFARKTFILSGTPTVTTNHPKTGVLQKTLTGNPDTVIEITLEDRQIKITAGEAKTTPPASSSEPKTDPAPTPPNPPAPALK